MDSTAGAAASPSPKKAKKKKAQKLASQQELESKPQRIVFNVFNTQYEVIGEVGKYDFNWKLSNRDPWYTQIEWDIQWADVAPPLDRWKDMKPFQKINHFPGMYQIARKNYLASNLNRMQKQFPADFQFFPKTWLLPHQLEDLKSYSAANPGANFIVKPEALSQGKGIFITKRFDQIDMSEHLVVQKYIKHPYLIDEYKFDFRIYILVTNVQPLRIFAFRDGLARLATEKYKQKAYNNPFIHLTNYAINKDNASFRADANADATTGHKRTLESIFVTLARDGVDIEALQAQMRDIVVKTLISVQPDLYHHYRTSQPSDIYNNMCFEILGFDILIDKTGKPWLLEVNHAPSFNCDTALDAKVKRRLVHDTFNLLNATVEEKNDIIALLKDMHEKRVIGINKTNKQAFYAQRQELQQIKLLENDAYQLANLGRFERLFPPMKHYVKAQIPVELPAAPTSDPLALKLWKLDQKLAAAQREEEQKKEQQQQSIQGNSTDEKLAQYYSVFLGISKSLNSEVKIANKQKQIELKQKAAQPVLAKAPIKKREAKIPEPTKKQDGKPELTTAQANDQEEYKQLEEESLASSSSSEPSGGDGQRRARQYRDLNKHYTQDNPQMGEFNERHGEEQTMLQLDTEFEDQSEQELTHLYGSRQHPFPKGQSFSDPRVLQVQNQNQHKRSLDLHHVAVLPKEGLLQQHHQIRVQQDPGPFSVVSLTKANTKAAPGLQGKLYCKDPVYAGQHHLQDPRAIGRPFASIGSGSKGDEKPLLRPGWSNSEVNTRNRALRATKLANHGERSEACLADQFYDQTGHLASIPAQMYLGHGQSAMAPTARRGLDQAGMTLHAGQEASRHTLAGLKAQKEQRRQNFTGAELSEHGLPGRYTQQPGVLEPHRLQTHVDMLESQRRVGLAYGSADPEARSHSQHAGQILAQRFEMARDNRGAAMSPQVHSLKHGAVHSKPWQPDAYRYHMAEGQATQFIRKEPALKFPQIDIRERGKSSQNLGPTDFPPLSQSLSASARWKDAHEVDRYIPGNYEALPANSLAAIAAKARSPPIPKLSKFRKDAPRLDPGLSNELMVHGYSDKFQGQLTGEQLRLQAQGPSAQETPSSFDRVPMRSPNPTAATSEYSRPPQQARAYQSGSKKTIYFSCDINFDKSQSGAQSVAPPRRQGVQPKDSSASTRNPLKTVDEGSIDEKLRASVGTPEEIASTPGKGLKGAKLKAHTVKKYIPTK